MKAIVTGGAGFIGRRLVERMVEKEWDVVVIDDFSTHTHPKFDMIDPYRKGKGGITFINAPVQDVSNYRLRDPNPDVIIHLAGKVGPIGVTKFKGLMVWDAVQASARTAVWAREFDCPLIFTSTSEVYGNSSWSNSEKDPTCIQLVSARSEYAVAKLAAEHMLLNQPGIDVRIIRPFNISGYGQRIEGGFVIPRFVKAMEDGDMMTLYQPGTQERSFTHVDDFLDGLDIVYRKGVSGEIYNIGNPNNRQAMIGLSSMIEHLYGTRDRTVVVDPKDLHGPEFREAPDKIPNADKLIDMGWLPYRHTRQIVEDVIRYHHEQRKDTSPRLSDPQQTRPHAEDAW
jgi:UDP-glucose 4-epimerase